MTSSERPSVPTEEIDAAHAVCRRLGNWTPARHLRVRVRHGAAMIDLRGSQIPEGQIEVNLDVDHGTVKLLVPERAVIDQWGLACEGRAKVKQTFHAGKDTGGGGRVINLTGKLRRGEVRVHSGGMAQLSAIITPEFFRAARHADRGHGVLTLDDPSRGADTGPGSGSEVLDPWPVTEGSVTSKDGTPIGYLRLGAGPAVVLLHGSMQSAQSHLGLARHLADAFTVYLPDRRGRGRSGPFGTSYSIDREVEDLEAVLGESGATRVYGISSSALVVLEAARKNPAIQHVAVYEPALLMNDSGRLAWLPQFDAEMADGNVAAALMTSMKGLRLGPPIMNVMPHWLLAAANQLAVKSEDRKAQPGDLTMRALAPTLHYEGQLLAEMEGKAASFGAVRARVLLMGGTKGLDYLLPAREVLADVLPHCERIEFDGLDHGASADVTKMNPHGRPEVIADALRGFFAP